MPDLFEAVLASVLQVASGGFAEYAPGSSDRTRRHEVCTELGSKTEQLKELISYLEDAAQV